MNISFKIIIIMALTFSYSYAPGLRASDDDPFAIFRLPSKQASVHHIKKDGNEFLHIKGDGLKNYELVDSEGKVSLRLKDHRVRTSGAVNSDSKFIKKIDSSVSDEGSSVNLELKGNPGFKLYERKSGLVLAMGPGYKEISEDILNLLERDVSLPSRIDRELDALISGDFEPSPRVSEIDSIIEELQRTTPVKDELDRELERILAEAESDIHRFEQRTVEAEMSSPRVLENIELSKVGDKVEILIRADRDISYDVVRSDEKQVVLEFPNTTVSRRLRTVDTKPSDGLIRSINYTQQDGPYPSSRVSIVLNDDLSPEFSHSRNRVSVAFMMGDYIDRQIRRILAEVEMDYKTAMKMIKEVEEKREFYCVDHQDYLSTPVSYQGRRMSIKVFDASIVDVLRMIQRVSRMNMIISENVKGTINVSLSNVPWDQALSVVLQNAQLGCVRQDSIMRIASMEELRDERLVAAEAVDAYRGLEPLRLIVARYTLKDSSSVERKLSVLLSNRGRIAVDDKNKMIVVRDVEDIVDQVSQLLTVMDVNSRVVKM